MKKMFAKIVGFFRAIGCLSLEKKYDLSLALYPDGTSSTPECQHRFQGESRHNVLKMIGAISAVAIPLILLCSLSSLCHRK